MYNRLEELRVDTNKLLDMTASEVGQLLRNHKIGGKVLQLASMLPCLHVEVRVAPITRAILRVTVELTCAFELSDRYHGQAEPFWVWVEDGENEYIYHSEQFMLTKKQKDAPHRLEFNIPVREPLPPQYYIRCVSDRSNTAIQTTKYCFLKLLYFIGIYRWLGSTTIQTVSFQHLILPDRMPPHTDLLDVHPVPKTALKNPKFEALYPRFSHFNPIQSQIFHALYRKDVNILVGAPTGEKRSFMLTIRITINRYLMYVLGSGKTIVAELAVLRLQNTRPGAKIVYVAPLKALARERVEVGHSH